MFTVNQKVKFKEGLFTQYLGDVAFTVTDVFTKGEDLPNGETYNGPDELYRLVTDEFSVPKPLRVLYQKECNLLPLETESGDASTEDADPAGEEENPDG